MGFESIGTPDKDEQILQNKIIQILSYVLCNKKRGEITLFYTNTIAQRKRLCLSINIFSPQ